MDWLGLLDGSLASHGLAFLGGLTTGFSPCVLPTVALVVAYVGGYGKGRGRALLLSMGFAVGLAVTLAALGFAAATAGNLAGNSPVMPLVAAGLCLLMGLMMLDVVAWELPGLRLGGARKGGGFVGALLLGIPFAFTASPCTTPVTVAVLGYASSRGVPLLGTSLLFFYGLGRSVPLLIAGTLAGTATSLVVSEVWTTRLRRLGGGVLVVVGLYLFWQAL